MATRTKGSIGWSSFDIPLEQRRKMSDATVEMCALGCAMLDPRVTDSILDRLSPEDFFSENNRSLFVFLKEMREDGIEINLPNVGSGLFDSGRITECGGGKHISDCLDSIPTAANGDHFCRILLHYSMRRQGAEALAMGVQGFLRQRGEVEYDSDPESAVSQIEATIEALQERADVMRGRIGGHTVDFQELVDTIMNDAIEREVPLERTGFDTGFPGLNYYTGGFNKGEFYVIAGRPSMGKSCAIASMLRTAAKEAPCAVYNFEGGSMNFTRRMMVNAAQISARVLKSEVLNPWQVQHLEDSRGELARLQIHLVSETEMRMAQLQQSIRRQVRDHGVEIVVVDHMGHVDTHIEDERRQATRVAMGLQKIAQRENVVMIGVSQLSRTNTGREDKRPQLQDLRNSGEIEQRADHVWFIHREGYYKKREERPLAHEAQEAEIIVAKCRDGQTGTVPAWCILSRTLFYPTEEEGEE